MRIQAVWRLANEDLTILEFGSLINQNLSLINIIPSFICKLFSLTNITIVYVLKAILTKMLTEILFMSLERISIKLYYNYQRGTRELRRTASG